MEWRNPPVVTEQGIRVGPDRAVRAVEQRMVDVGHERCPERCIGVGVDRPGDPVGADVGPGHPDLHRRHQLRWALIARRIDQEACDAEMLTGAQRSDPLDVVPRRRDQRIGIGFVAVGVVELQPRHHGNRMIATSAAVHAERLGLPSEPELSDCGTGHSLCLRDEPDQVPCVIGTNAILPTDSRITPSEVRSELRAAALQEEQVAGCTLALESVPVADAIHDVFAYPAPQHAVRRWITPA